VASTALLSVKVAAVDYGEVGRSQCIADSNGPRALPQGMPALTGESSVYSVSTFTRKCLLCKQGFKTRK
jgi:hypothetical protein